MIDRIYALLALGVLLAGAGSVAFVIYIVWLGVMALA